jgi:tripartite-type tricarboxylate transporter receptor subunit TctC
MKARLISSAVVVLLCAGAACAQNYPTRPLRFIVPFPPGGGADSLARIVGAVAGESLGQSIVIDNRTGAGGNIAAEAGAKAAPDGYTLLQSNISHAISASLYRKLDYDIVRDFVHVTLLASIPFALAVHPSLNVASVRELVALAKSKPGQLIYASSGNGGPSHLAMEMFKTLNGIDIRHVPYKGAAPIATDLVAGQVQMAFFTTAGLLPLIANARVKPLALASSRRSPLIPDLPTFTEQGMAGFEATTWFGVSLPKGASPAIVKRLHAVFTQALKVPEVRERLDKQGFDVIGNSPEEFDAYLRAELQRWSQVVKESRASVD